MLMPPILNLVSALLNNLDERIQRSRRIAIIIGKSNLWIKPELCIAIAACNMDMHWLARIAFVGVKVETKATLTKDNWHRLSPNFLHNAH
jgi:hypothetical protein